MLLLTTNLRHSLLFSATLRGLSGTENYFGSGLNAERGCRNGRQSAHNCSLHRVHAKVHGETVRDKTNTGAAEAQLKARN